MGIATRSTSWAADQPGTARASAVGCADPRMAAIMAEVFAQRGNSVLVLHGEDGLDEFTTTAPTKVWAVSGGAVTPLVIDAADLGLPRATPADLRGGEVAVNAAVATGSSPARPGRCATLCWSTPPPPWSPTTVCQPVPRN